LGQQLRKARHDAIAAYAAKTAGTDLDLDAKLEAAGIEHLITTGEGIEVRRGEVHWADLVPRSGSGQTGRRPVIVVSHDGFNQTAGWRSILVVPISTSALQGKRGPTVIEIPAAPAVCQKTSFAVCHQVTTLDRTKLARQLSTAR
jgi:mRNA interferase MazF